MRVLTILFCLFFSATLMAGPWPQPKGKGYFKLYEWWLRFDQHYTSTGELDPNATLGLYNTSVYAEYGLTDRLTGIINLPLYSRNVINNQISGTRGNVAIPGEAIGGLGDTDLSLQYALNAPGSSVPIAVRLTLGLPLGEDAGGEQMNLQTGDGEFNQLLTLSAGKSLTQDLYAIASVGFNNRTNGFSDEFRYDLEAGYGLANQRVWLTARVSGSESFMNGETAETISSTSVFSNNAEYLSVGGGLSVLLTRKVGVSLGAATAVSGRIIAAAPSFNVGIFVDTSK